jgi:hypothetical protein
MKWLHSAQVVVGAWAQKRSQVGIKDESGVMTDRAGKEGKEKDSRPGEAEQANT